MQHERAKSGRRRRVVEPLARALRREDRSEIERQRVVGTARALDRFAEAQARDEKIRRELERTTQRVDRLIEPAERGVGDAEIGQRDGIVRAHAARTFEQRERLREAAALVRADRDEIERIGLARRFAQDIEEGLLGFENASAVGELPRGVDARPDFRFGRAGCLTHVRSIGLPARMLARIAREAGAANGARFGAHRSRHQSKPAFRMRFSNSSTPPLPPATAGPAASVIAASAFAFGSQ